MASRGPGKQLHTAGVRWSRLRTLSQRMSNGCRTRRNALMWQATKVAQLCKSGTVTQAILTSSAFWCHPLGRQAVSSGLRIRNFASTHLASPLFSFGTVQMHHLRTCCGVYPLMAWVVSTGPRTLTSVLTSRMRTRPTGGRRSFGLAKTRPKRAGGQTSASSRALWTVNGLIGRTGAPAP